MYFENQPPCTTKRSMSSLFFKMQPNNFILHVEFILRSREDIIRFIQTLDQDTRKPIDLFFICEDINLYTPFNPPHYFAVFTCFIGAIQPTKAAFEAIAFCKMVDVTIITIAELFKRMCERSFIEINFFQRLGQTDSKTLKKTANPFAQVYLAQNVTLFNNLDMAYRFISQDMTTFTNSSQYRPTIRQPTEETKKFSRILYGTIKINQIHLTDHQSKIIQKLYEQLKTYETLNDDDTDMPDQAQEFDNVSYINIKQTDFSSQDFVILTNLKQRRQASIMQIRDKLKSAERKLLRSD